MKKTLILSTVVSTALAGSTFAQGIIDFVASTANGKISYSLDGTTVAGPAPTGNPSLIPLPGGGTGALTVAFYTAPNGTVLTLAGGDPNFTTAWTEAAITVGKVTPQAGLVPSTPVTTSANSGGAGANVELEVVGWTGTATSFAGAVASGGDIAFTGSALSGGSLGWSQATGNPDSTPAGSAVPIVTGSGGYAGLVLAPVPEPTTIALGGLGAAALLMFRRRK
jgi:hypothetical protein